MSSKRCINPECAIRAVHGVEIPVRCPTCDSVLIGSSYEYGHQPAIEVLTEIDHYTRKR